MILSIHAKPATYYHESEQEYEQPSSSDDGVQVEAEDSEFEEVGHEDSDDDCDNGGVERDKVSEDGYDNGGIDEETPVVGCAGLAPLASRRMDQPRG